MDRLKHPGSDIDFRVDAGYFLADLNVYDREESLGVMLDKFDPNSHSDLQELVSTKILGSKRFARLSSEHKLRLLAVLREALQNDNDLDRFFNRELFEDGFSLPFSWDVRNPIEFFDEIYRQARELWELG